MAPQVAAPDVELVRSDRTAPADRLVGCRAEVPGELLDEQGQILDGLISFAFDLLDARYLEVRVVPAGAGTGQLAAARAGGRMRA